MWKALLTNQQFWQHPKSRTSNFQMQVSATWWIEKVLGHQKKIVGDICILSMEKKNELGTTLLMPWSW
jgi:hypothetical protein